MKTVRSFFTLGLTLVFLAGCSGRFDYVRPAGSDGIVTSLTVAKSKDDVWRQIVPTFPSARFVIQSLDRDTGIIVLSYTGDPERYVDCGEITSQVKNLRGERTYRFPAAAAATEYEYMNGREILVITRHMHLDGRLNLTVADAGPQQTQVLANAQYTLTRTLIARDTQGQARTSSQRIAFTSRHEGALPGDVTCRSNGVLEKEALSAIAQ